MRTRPCFQFLQGTSRIACFRPLDAENYDLKVYAILDEIFLAGEVQETSKDVVLSRLDVLDRLE